MPKVNPKKARVKATSSKTRVTRPAKPVRSKSAHTRSSELETLRRQLDEAQETLRAITSGEVDALVVAGPQGEQVFTLKDADRPYRHLAEQMYEGACTLNAQGIVLFANSFFTRLLGLPMDQVLGASFSGWIQTQDQPRFAELLQQALACSAKDELELVSAGGEPLPVQLSLSLLQAEEGPRITVVVFDLRERKRNEQALRQMNRELEERVAERTAQWQTANEELEVANEEYHSANEELTETNRRLHDEIAERQLAEEALRESEQRYRRLIETAEEGIAIHEPDGTITYVNQRMANMLGYPREELIGRSSLDFVEDEEREAVYRARESVKERGNLSTERKLRRKGGQVLWTLANVSPRHDSSGRFVGYLAMHTDITQRKLAEDQVNQLNRDLEQRAAELELVNRDLESFTYSVSHDLRAPLSTIENFAHLLLEDYGPQVPDEAHPFLRLIQANAQATNHLVEALLRLSRAGRQAVNKQPIDMREMVDQAVRELRPMQGERQVDWAIGELRSVNADPVLIKQVWTNLLSNALKYSRGREQTQIQVGIETRDGEAVYFVKDNGVGFDMAQAKHLFGVFQRLHSEEEFEGTGIGLAIVDRIVRRHGGHAWAEGEVGKGATFYFTL